MPLTADSAGIMMISILKIWAMAKINFLPLFEYLDEKFASIDDKFDSMQFNFNDLQTSVDGIAKQLTDNTTEIKSLNHRTERMENWIKKVAPKVDIPYEI